MSIAEPAKIITPWADTGSKNPIPQNSNNATGAAGYDKGFPDITMTPPEAGGIPPAGQDFNGIFYEVTKILQYMQAGGQPTFSATLASGIGGYPVGAMVLGDDGVAIYTNRVDGNSSNPNSGGSGWAREDLMLREALRRSYAEAGYNLVDGSFEAGGTLVNANDVLLQERTGKAFSGPAGPVAAGTDPTSGGFVDESGILDTTFPTVATMIAAKNLAVGKTVRWLGYYSALDDGGNIGIVRAGTPPFSADGGSIFVISSSLYIEADMRWPTIRQFGGGTDGDNGITPAKNLAAMNAILAYATRTGKRVYAGTVKTMSVSAGVKVTLDGPLDFFGTKSFKLTWVTTTDHLVEIVTPTNVTKSGLALYRLNTDGGRYGIFAHAGKFGDNLLNVIDDVSITYCKAERAWLAGHHVYHGQNVDVSHNFYYKCGDNGAYIPFSRNATCNNNMVHNCRGSAGIVMGYCDTVVAEGLLAANNIIWNDADADNVPTASGVSSLGGVWMGHNEGGMVCNNVIWNEDRFQNTPIQSGVWVDENTVRNVKVFGNHITNMRQMGVFVGSTAGTQIRNVEISNNKIVNCRDGIKVDRGNEIFVKNNEIEYTSQHAVLIAVGVKYAEVASNRLKCCGGQETFNTMYVINNGAAKPVTLNNTIDDTPAKITLADPSGTVTVKVNPANTNIDVFVSGSLVSSIVVVRGVSIWGDVHLAITAIPQLSGSTFIGDSNQEIISIKRTGAPSADWAIEEPANGYILSYMAPFGYIKQTGGVCRGNQLLSDYLSCKVTTGNMYNAQKCNSLTNVVDRDTNDWGGGRGFIGTARPTTGYYRQGDTVSSKLDGGSFSERCTVSGYPGTWVTA